MKFVKRFFVCLLLSKTVNIHAQNADSVFKNVLAYNNSSVVSEAKIKINKIIIEGNKKTNAYILLREIQFKEGDSLPFSQIKNQLKLVRQQLYNTTLFNEISVSPIMISISEINVLVSVKERWYLYPFPQFQLGDRNLNEWLVKQHGDISRVSYGVKFVHHNLTGRRDVLRITALNGYTKNLSFSYTQPFSNKDLTSGFNFGAGYAQSKEIAYSTSSLNKLQFLKTNNYVRNNYFINAGYSIRKAIKARHLFNIIYNKTSVSDSVVSPLYNPDYFKNSVTSKSFADINYTYQYTDVNNIIYPLKGVTALLILSKRGFGFTGGINMFSVEGAYNTYHDLSRNWFGSLQFSGKIKLPFNQPYFNQKAIGYGENYLRGLEYYVIDGAVYGIIKSTLKKKLVSFSIPFSIKSSYLSRIPFTIYAKTFADLGYAYNKSAYETALNNKLLYTTGVGVDIITLYDIHFKVEYSFNQLGKNGLFLHPQGGF